MLCHARYSLAPDADNAVYPPDGVIAQKRREVVVLVHGNSQGQAVAGAGVGVSPTSPQNCLWTCLQEKVAEMPCPAICLPHPEQLLSMKECSERKKALPFPAFLAPYHAKKPRNSPKKDRGCFLAPGNAVWPDSLALHPSMGYPVLGNVDARPWWRMPPASVPTRKHGMRCQTDWRDQGKAQGGIQAETELFGTENLALSLYWHAF